MRVLAALTACAFVLAGLLGTIHEATTRHIVCAAHGELIHADTPTHVAKSLQRDAAARELPATGVNADEHCALASAMRQSRVAPDAPMMTTAVATADDLVLVVPHRTPPAPSSLYRTAPKTSPPA